MTRVESRFEEKPWQSDSCEALRETVRSSSPVFSTMMSYNAAESVVAVEFVGLAVRFRAAAAKTGVETNEVSNIATMITAESGLLID